MRAKEVQASPPLHWIINNMNMMITFLRCENCIELCKFRNDWFEVLAGLTLLSSKLPRLEGIVKKVLKNTEV